MFKNTVWLVLFISIFLMAGIAKAEWIDDWFQQKVYTGPNHYKSSTRGYGTFGSASLRWNNSRDYLLGISPPQFKSGCGGIDLFFGGYQFMDIDHLVSKLTAFANPGVMAALATDIAMSVLSEQVADSVKSLMAIVDRLNQLQFDDCQAQKTVSAVIKAGFDPENFSEKASQAVSRYAISAGLSNLYDEIKNFGNGRTPGAALGSAGGTVTQMVSGCPEDLKDIYFSQGYVLDHLVTKLGVPYRSDYVALMRGLVGDIFIDTSGGNINYRVEKPCAQNPGIADITLSHFVDGNVQKMDSAGQCVA
ncbi:MAG: conjugal transfer protein TraH, partial [Proteobacteria bacterium]|nr:conjugal transfer protein TraH [Pseudomonadota bacterium]